MGTLHQFRHVRPIEPEQRARIFNDAAAAKHQEHIRTIRDRTAKREHQTRSIRTSFGFLAANWFAASLVTCCVLYLLAEFAR